MPPNLNQDHIDSLRYTGLAGDEDLNHGGTTTSVLRCALLGCGMMGQEHISYMAGYPHQVRLDFLCDPHQPSLDKSLQVLREFQVLSKGGHDHDHHHQPKLLYSESQLLEQHAHEIDLLVIATPNYLHADTICRWARYEHVTILCEKPVAVSQAQHDKLAALAASSSDALLRARIWIAMEYRFIPAVAQVLRLLQEPSSSNIVGDIHMITIRENRYPFLHKIGKWNRLASQTGDTLVEKCCHFFDLFRLLTAAEVHLPRVRAMAQRGINYRNELEQEDDPAAANTSSSNPKEEPIIDAAYVMFPMRRACKNNDPTTSSCTLKRTNIMACLELCMYAEGSRHQEEIIITGSKGRLEAYLPENKVYAYRRPTEDEWSDRSIPPTPVQPVVYDCSNVAAVHGIDDGEHIPTHGGYHYSSTAVEWYKLIRAIRVYEKTNIWKPDVSLADGLAAVQIGLQATRALKEDLED